MNQSNYLYSIINPNGESQDLFQHPIYFNYAADQDGNIYNLVKKSICTQFTNTLGYLYIWLYDNNKNRKNIKSHRFIYECLTNSIIENSKVIDHIDRDRKNNHISNLRAVSPRTNGLNKYLNEEVKSLPDDAIEIKKYKDHEFTGIYFSKQSCCCFKTCDDLIFKIPFKNNCGYKNITSVDNNGNSIKLYYLTLTKICNN